MIVIDHQRCPTVPRQVCAAIFAKLDITLLISIFAHLDAPVGGLVRTALIPLP